MIKKLNEKNINLVMNLHKKAIFPIWNKLRRKYTLASIRKFALNIFKNGEVFGFIRQNKIIAIIGIECKFNKLEICFLLVDPKYQGKGIGKKLMIFVENKYSKRIKKIYLDVLIKNPAVKLYKRLGYKLIRIKNKKQKYVMEKKI